MVWTVGILVLLWAIVIVNAIVNHRLLDYGIRPRETRGLVGIVAAPFLHEDAAHLAANTLPLAAFAWLLLTAGARQFVIVTVAVILASGAIDWAVGPAHTVIVGASGVIFGWFGYLLARGWFARSVRAIAVALLVGAVFSGLFSGLLPKVDSNVFWGGHLAGFVVGVLVAALMHRRRPKPARPATTPVRS